MALTDYQTSVADLTRDRDGLIAPLQRDAAIAAAVAQYSMDVPRQIVVDVIALADGNALPLPAGWDDNSTLIAIEYPIGNWPSVMLPVGQVQIYASPTTRQFMLPVAIVNGDAARVTYTAPHQLDATSDTTPVRHQLAIASLAASILCGQLASYYATESEPTIAADSVDRKTMSDRWRSRQRDLAGEYTRVIGMPVANRNKAASATKALERSDSLGGARMFHPPTNWPVN